MGRTVDLVAALRAAGCVFAEDEARLLVEAASTPEQLAELVGRRVSGVPIEHLLGWVDFCGRRFAVDPGVFVPRRRTELLVTEAARRCRDGAVVVDLCCGSGAVGAAIAAARGPLDLHAVDADDAAARCARRNLAVAGGTVYVGDLYAPLPAALRGGVDVVVANAPYVPTAEMVLMPPEARTFEQPAALDGGADGLDVQRRVAEEARSWLVPGGHLLVETSERQAARSVEIVTAGGLRPQVVRSEALDATVVVGERRRQ